MKGPQFMAFLFAMSLVGGCSGDNKPPGASAPATTSSSQAASSAGPTRVGTSNFSRLPTQAQPKLQTIKLWLGPEELTTELALTLTQQTTGMMFRTNMAENEGMLFVFSGPHRASFWMMNTYVPLSAAYINPEGVVLEIHNLEPLNTNSVEAASDDVQ